MESIIELQRKLNEEIENEKKRLLKEKEAIMKEKEELHQIHNKLNAVHGQRVKLDIGGTIFATSLSTLTNNTSKFFTAMFSGRWELKKEEDGSYFIDRDPTVFQGNFKRKSNLKVILNFMRGESISLSEIDQKRLLLDAQYYQIPSLEELIVGSKQQESDVLSSSRIGPHLQLSDENKTVQCSTLSYNKVISEKG